MNTMRLLIIEDDENMLLSLSLSLQEDGYLVDTARDGAAGYDLARLNEYNLIILDCNLPRLSGQEIVRKLRAEGKATPILILTVLSEINDKVSLLELGADDYLTKPFSIAELRARIKAIIRRPNRWPGKIFQCGGLEMDIDKAQVTRNGRRISLPAKEFDLLAYFLANPGRVLSRQELLENVWDENSDPFSNTIEVHIMNLRKKIETKKDKLIWTVPTRGYKLEYSTKK